MAKKIRFPLKLAEDKEVRTLDELREHFDLEKVLEYYKNGKLLTWLEDRYLEGEAEAVRGLDETKPDFQRQLCTVFQVDYTGDDVDLEEIERRQERLKRLRSITDNAEFIQNIDLVAFDQEDLADLLDDEQKRIYLCGETFQIPVSQKDVTYIGINEPVIHLTGNVPKDAQEVGIIYENCRPDNWPESILKDHDKRITTKLTDPSKIDLAHKIRGFLDGIGMDEYDMCFVDDLIEIYGGVYRMESLADLFDITVQKLSAVCMDRSFYCDFERDLREALATVPDYKILGSIGIPNVGPTQAKMILKHYGGWNKYLAEWSKADEPGMASHMIINSKLWNSLGIEACRVVIQDTTRKLHKHLAKYVKNITTDADGGCRSDLARKIFNFLKGIGMYSYGSSFANDLVETYGTVYRMESLVDLFDVTEQRLDDAGMTDISYRYFADHLRKAIAETPDYKVLGSIGIPDLGPAKAKALLQNHGGWKSFVHRVCGSSGSIVAKGGAL